MRGHIVALGVIHLVIGGLSAIAGTLLLLAGLGGGFSALVQGESEVGMLLGSMGTLLGLVLVVSGLPELLAGIGLLKLRPWGRLVAIAVSVLSLPAFPLGTLLGGYGLWVLLSAQGAVHFQSSGVGLTEVAVMAGTHMLRDEERKPRSPLASLAMALLVLLGLGAGALWWFGQRAAATSIGRTLEEVRVTVGGKGSKPTVRKPPRPDEAPVKPVKGGGTAPAPAEEPESVDESEVPAGDDAAVYTFRDEKGREHYVNGLERVPAHLRATARRMQ
jgi:hypothetical protein